MDAVVSVPGAEPWSAQGSGSHEHVGVVVVHDLAANPISTRPLGQRLAAEGCAVEVVLLPGHGTNHRDLARTRYADWCDAVQRTVDHLRPGCAAIVLVGHGLGGTIALDLASRRPDDIAALAVVNPVVLDSTRRLARLAPLLRRAVPYLPRDLAGLPTDDIARPGVEDQAYALVPPRALQSLLDELPRIRSQLGRLVQPLLVAWSPDDHTVAAAHALALRDLVASPDVTEVVCDRSYHVVMLDYDAARLEEAVVTFVDENAHPAGPAPGAPRT